MRSVLNILANKEYVGSSDQLTMIDLLRFSGFLFSNYISPVWDNFSYPLLARQNMAAYYAPESFNAIRTLKGKVEALEQRQARHQQLGLVTLDDPVINFKKHINSFLDVPYDYLVNTWGEKKSYSTKLFSLPLVGLYIGFALYLGAFLTSFMGHKPGDDQHSEILISDVMLGVSALIAFFYNYLIEENRTPVADLAYLAKLDKQCQAASEHLDKQVDPSVNFIFFAREKVTTILDELLESNQLLDEELVAFLEDPLLTKILDTDQPIGQAFHHYCEQLGRATLPTASELFDDCRVLVQRDVRSIASNFQLDQESMQKTKGVVNAMREWVKQERLVSPEKLLAKEAALDKIAKKLDALYDATTHHIDFRVNYNEGRSCLGSIRSFTVGGR
jgi:hypothetical protein